MALYFFYQPDEKGKWYPALASERDNIIKTKKPALVTALDVDNSFDHDLTVEEIRNLRYSGPFYADWDAENIDEAITQFKAFLTNLKAKDVNLDMLRLYATGKKGFHLEIPQAVFMGKPPANGMLNLPDVYREMAHSLFVETLDMRVYTARRGRMWRCTNVLRDNGKYKVQITPEEAFAMTPELYSQLCDSPRNSLPIEPPAINAELGLLFAQSRDRVEAGVAKKRQKRQTTDILLKFNGEWPETLKLILQGVIVKPEVGWNLLSMQLAITASALGKTEEQLLADAQPLIESHESDSSRYNTPTKRIVDLREMFRYINGNPVYDFSVGGIMALVMPECRANSDLMTGDWQADDKPEKRVEKQVQVQEDGSEIEVEVEVEVVEEEDDNAPVRISRYGIFVRAETGYIRASDLGIGRAVALKRMDGQDIGYDVEVFKHGKPIGTHMLTMDKLTSRSAFQSFSFQWSASMSASDIQTAKIADILSRKSEKNNDITYVVTREGVDLVVPPGAKSEDDFEIIWAAPDRVIGSKGGKYRYRNPLDKNGTFQSDLLNAPDLTEADAQLIDRLLKINTTKNLASLLGWFFAVPMTQIIRRFYKQFPSMQVFGQAGAGKSQTIELLNHLYYFMKSPKQLQANGTTNYPLLVAVGSSASQPVIFEEVKAREMTKTLHDFLLNIFRCNYNGFSIARGSLTKDSASKDVTVTSFDNVGPVVFVGEAVESQSAIMERCIVVSMSKPDHYGKVEHFHYCQAKAPDLGRLGKALVMNTLAIDTKEMRNDLDAIHTQLIESLGERAHDCDRAVFNQAVITLGLHLGKSTLHRVFGDRFDERMDELIDHLMGNVDRNIPDNMSEASRVLDVMAQLSHHPEPQYMLVNGVDYEYFETGTIDIKLRTSFAKYIKWQRSLGQEALFDNETAFITAMQNYGGTIKRTCPDNINLHNSVKAVVYRLNLEYLEKEGVDSFKE